MESVLVRHEQQEAILRRVRSEYRELPGLSPTLAQAQRLFGLDRDTCGAVLERLTHARFLSRTPKGRYVRRDVAS